MRVGAVGIGDDQLIALRRRFPVDGHVGDARRERAAHAEYLQVDGVTHAVRGVAQCTRAADKALRSYARPGERVHQVEVHREVAVVERAHAPDYDVVAPHGLPAPRANFIGARRRGRHALARQRAKASAALEVVLHHVGDVQSGLGGGGVRERHDRDRHRVAHARGDLDVQLGSRDGSGREESEHGDRAEPREP
jgi:hypothetical protein